MQHPSLFLRHQILVTFLWWQHMSVSIAFENDDANYIIVIPENILKFSFETASELNFATSKRARGFCLQLSPSF